MAETPLPMESADLLDLLRRGDEAAAAEVFERYAERLTLLARVRLSTRLAARVDAEDIVQSAWRSFFVAARAGRFRVEQGGDLWRLLVEMTLHKLYRQAAHHQAQRRSLRREAVGNEALLAASAEPTPAEAEAAADELEAVLKQLPERGRQSLVLRLQGYEHAEIAAQLGCAERTVRRALSTARRLLAARGGGDFIPSAARRSAAAPPQPVVVADVAEARLAWSDFALHEQIGSGASGRVYRAWQQSTNREVAIKFLRKSLAAHAPAVARFLREARTVAALAHPGIVAVHGAGRTPGGGFFLHLDLVRGQDLQRVLAAGPVAWQPAATWVAAAARIVHFAHQRGIIHCDLKPSNLLLDEQGRVRVTDFGLATSVSGGEPDAVLAGTPAFMAPEQVDSRWGEISPRTDVYGLAAVLFALLFGHPPHRGRNLAEVLSRVGSDSPVEIPVSSAIPAALLSLLRECLTKSAALRPASAESVALALESCCVANALPCSDSANQGR